jgi:hypothetical protein
MARKPAPKTTKPPNLVTARDVQVGIAAAEARVATDAAATERRIATIIAAQYAEVMRFLGATKIDVDAIKTNIEAAKADLERRLTATTKERADDTVRHIVSAVDHLAKRLETEKDTLPRKPPSLEMITTMHHVLGLVRSDTLALLAMGEGLQRRLAQIELSLEHVRSRLPAPGPAPKNPKIKKNKRH